MGICTVHILYNIHKYLHTILYNIYIISIVVVGYRVYVCMLFDAVGDDGESSHRQLCGLRIFQNRVIPVRIIV